ncbi:MAG: peroxide stress protein YaaA [Anaeroplasmataceae bacterium]
MKIIISPAKKMRSCDFYKPKSTPIFINESNELLDVLKNLDLDSLKQSMNLKDKLGLETFNLYKNIDTSNIDPAILSYDGIMYKYMGIDVFNNNEFKYIEDNLYIISGLFGLLKPFDGIYKYRLEFNTKINNIDLYEFWSDKIYKELFKDSDIVINLASNEYSKTIRKYLKPNNKFIDIKFYEKDNDKLIEKGVYVKIARGEMIKYLASNNINDLEGIKNFNYQEYQFDNSLSNDMNIIFVR